MSPPIYTINNEQLNERKHGTNTSSTSYFLHHTKFVDHIQNNQYTDNPIPNIINTNKHGIDGGQQDEEEKDKEKSGKYQVKVSEFGNIQQNYYFVDKIPISQPIDINMTKMSDHDDIDGDIFSDLTAITVSEKEISDILSMDSKSNANESPAFNQQQQIPPIKSTKKRKGKKRKKSKNMENKAVFPMIPTRSIELKEIFKYQRN